MHKNIIKKAQNERENKDEKYSHLRKYKNIVKNIVIFIKFPAH